MPLETPVDIAYEHAKEGLAVQRARLDNLRARSAAVITAASVLASFLGGQALADTKSLPKLASPVPDRSLQPWECVGFGAFLVVLGLNAWIIKPKTKGWTFRLNARKLLASADAGACEEERRMLHERRFVALRRRRPVVDKWLLAQQQKRELAEHMEDYYARNEPKIERLFGLLQLSVVLLAVEAVGFMLDLTI